MKKNEKIIITALIVVAIIIVTVLAIVRFGGGNKEDNNSNTSSSENITEEDVQVNEYVSESSNGIKTNTSDKMYETKQYQGLDVKIDYLKEVNNLTQILGTIKNTSDTVYEGGSATLKVLDEKGKEIISLEIMIRELEPGEETQLNTNATFDFVNAFDYVIE